MSLLARNLILKKGGRFGMGGGEAPTWEKASGLQTWQVPGTVRTAWLEHRVSIRSPEVRCEGREAWCIWEMVQNHIEVFKFNSV